MSYTTERFIEKAINVHGPKFDYSNVNYISSIIKVDIICSDHGEFRQAPAEHLRGKGCYKCSYKKHSSLLKSNRDLFIKKATLIHKEYDYSKVIYIDSSTKVEIVCLKHGSFWCTPNNHLNKSSSCPKCKSSKGEEAIRKYLDLKNIFYEEQKTFEDCKDKIKLRFDFYLPSHNLLIEFDGIGHFKPTTFGGCSIEDAVKKLKYQKNKDQIKNQYCINSKIRLIRISYNKIKNIDMIMDGVINEAKICKSTSVTYNWESQVSDS